MKEIIGWFPAQGNLLDWLTAIGTFGAVFITIIATFWKKIFGRAIFVVEKEDFVVGTKVDNEEMGSLSFGFRVKQIRGFESSDVECILKRVWRYDIFSANKKEEWNNLPISNLSWGSGKSIERFSNGVERRCNLFQYLEEDPFLDFGFESIRVDVLDKLNYLPENGYSSALPVNEVYKFRFDILIIGENVKPKSFSIDLFVKKRERLDEKGEIYIENIKNCFDVKII